MRGASGPTVLKLGGSYAFSPFLKNWIDAVKDCAGCVVVVPGGGPFADTVRAAQPRMGFDDQAAHHMALLAMAQYGCALRSRHPAFVVLNSAAQIAAAVVAGQVPIWSPIHMALAAPELPASWQV